MRQQIHELLDERVNALAARVDADVSLLVRRAAQVIEAFERLAIGGQRAASGGRPSGGVADARGDHRMAMAFAIAALAAEQPSTIDGADAVVISYPRFFETLGRLTT